MAPEAVETVTFTFNKRQLDAVMDALRSRAAWIGSDARKKGWRMSECAIALAAIHDVQTNILHTLEKTFEIDPMKGTPNG